MGKIVKIEHSYNLSDYFSNVTFDGVWQKLINYLQENKALLNKIVLYKEDNKIKIQSVNEHELIDIIKTIDPSGFFKKNLIRTIKLNVKFNKELKELEITNENIDSYENSNIIEYTITFDNCVKNDVYFHESSLLINYENINRDLLLSSNYRLCVIFYDEAIDGTNQLNEKYLLCAYNLSNDKIIFINELCEDASLNQLFSSVINSYNTTKTFRPLISFNNKIFTNFELKITNVILIDDSYKSVLLFKNSMNNYIFESYIKSLHK